MLLLRIYLGAAPGVGKAYDPDSRQLFLDYDRAHDLDADDPHIDDLARRIVEALRLLCIPRPVGIRARIGP
ncbi:hypothetical protein ABZ935_39770 [Streptomyces coeruleorubidus]|uniref:hypothetical protein n=1 Tax=Streptomyces coeruleorubidus TaxID=116188 RepID=UPI0033F94120